MENCVFSARVAIEAFSGFFLFQMREFAVIPIFRLIIVIFCGTVRTSILFFAGVGINFCVCKWIFF